MDSLRMLATLLIIAGVLGLAYGGFSYTEETHQANIGALYLPADEKQSVNIPVWAGVSAILAGEFLLVIGRRS